MAETVSVHDLSDTDIIDDLALLLTESADVDGITIDDATATRLGLEVTLADSSGATRTVTLFLARS